MQGTLFSHERLYLVIKGFVENNDGNRSYDEGGMKEVTGSILLF